MAEIPPLTEDDVFDFVGAASIAKGRSYVAHSLSGLRQQGSVLKGRCQGTADEPYRVEVRFDQEELEDAYCSCPVGDGGGCKHVAALLLAWCSEPERFLETEVLEASLKRRTKDELIALIQQMLAQEPDLEWLLATPLPGAKHADTAPDPEVYHRQAEAAFRNAGSDWRASYGVAAKLSGIVQLGDAFQERNDFAAAAAVYRGVQAAILEHYFDLRDEEGEIGSVVNECVEGLGSCLQSAAGGLDRAAILRALFDAYVFDVTAGGISLADEAPGLLIDAATPEERRMVAGWVRSILENPGQAGLSGGIESWGRSALGGLLLDLEEDELDDEGYLAICRGSGRIGDAVERLLQSGRLDEAIAETRGAGDYALIALADLFVEQGHPDAAAELIRTRSRASQDSRPVEWLKRRAVETGDREEAVRLARQLFDARPYLEGYRELRGRYRDLDAWETARPEIMRDLDKQGHRVLLLQIHLEEGEIDSALAILAQPRAASWYGWIGGDLRLQVARAAEEQRPEASIAIYRELAEQAIQARGRGNYQLACRHLERVRYLLHRSGRDQEWEEFIGRLRAEHSTLRALKEELADAGL
jgi:uncharacterized Zn finger protein